MMQPMPKLEYLAELEARNSHNRQLVTAVFVPLDQAQRSWQPAPKEWSVDQCFQHLIRAFAGHVPNISDALSTPEPANSDGIYRHTWLARKTMAKQFDPKTKGPTMKKYNPTATYSPDVMTHFLAQQDRLMAIIEQAAQANLQTMCWIIKGFPIRYNLGDYLNFFVSHDELHIDQAQRVLAAYEQKIAVSPV